MISAQTRRACREGKPLRTDHALEPRFVLGEMLPPVRAAQHAHDRGCDRGGKPKLGFPVFEDLADRAAVAAKKAEFQPVELPLDLVEKWNQKRQIDRVGKRDPERADLAALERRCQRTGAGGCLIALLQK